MDRWIEIREEDGFWQTCFMFYNTACASLIHLIGKGYWEQIMGHTYYIELTVDFEWAHPNYLDFFLFKSRAIGYSVFSSN